MFKLHYLSNYHVSNEYVFFPPFYLKKLQNWYYYTSSEILYKLQLTIHRIYYFYYLLFIQLSQQVAARQREPYRYSMCCLRTFCILLLYIFMLSQYVFYNIMHYVK